MNAFRDDLVAWRRAPFGGATGDQDWVFLGENLTGATAKMQVRFTPGDTGTPLIGLTETAGLAITYSATVTDPETGLVVGGTTVRPSIARATFEALATAADPTQPLVLAYDLHVTPSAGVEQLRAYGSFTINPGVTI